MFEPPGTAAAAFDAAAANSASAVAEAERFKLLLLPVLFIPLVLLLGNSAPFLPALSAVAAAMPLLQGFRVRVAVAAVTAAAPAGGCCDGCWLLMAGVACWCLAAPLLRRASAASLLRRASSAAPVKKLDMISGAI
jgi:hypothetical protein